MSATSKSCDVSREVVKSLFKKYDEDGSGTLEKNEFLKLLKDDMALEEQSANVCYSSVDKDGDGGVSFDEFLPWFQTGEAFKNVSKDSRFYKICEAAETFRQWDKDGSGSMDAKEFTAFLQSTGYKDKADDLLKQLDQDGDGNISFEEFLGCLNWL